MKGWIREFVKVRYFISFFSSRGDREPRKGFNQGNDTVSVGRLTLAAVWEGGAIARVVVRWETVCGPSKTWGESKLR